MKKETDIQEEKIIMGSRSEEIVQCGSCGKEIKIGDGQAYEGKNGEDIYFCPECVTIINEALENETKNPNIFGATALGILAGIVGGVLWYFITVITNVSIGYIAIGLGWLIGTAVCLGAGRKKGSVLQLLSSVIMIITLIASEFMIFLHYVGTSPEVNSSAAGLLLGGAIAGKLGFLFSKFLQNSISPIGLLIWGFGLYVAYMLPRARRF